MYDPVTGVNQRQPVTGYETEVSFFIILSMNSNIIFVFTVLLRSDFDHSKLICHSNLRDPSTEIGILLWE